MSAEDLLQGYPFELAMKEHQGGLFAAGLKGRKGVWGNLEALTGGAIKRAAQNSLDPPATRRFGLTVNKFFSTCVLADTKFLMR